MSRDRWGFEGELLAVGGAREVWAGLGPAPGRGGVWAGLPGEERLYTCALKALFPCAHNGGGLRAVPKRG